MQIECTIRRRGGTVVNFDERSRERLGLPPGRYHFKPANAAPDAPHVAEVSNAAHVDHFLTIRTFRLVHGEAHGEAAAPASAPTLPAAPQAPQANGFDADAVQKLSVRDLREKVDGLDAEQTRAVLQLEQDQGDDARSSVVELLMARLRKIEGQ